MRSLVIPVWGLLLLATLVRPAAAQFPTANFVQDEYIVFEADTQVTVTINVSETAFGGIGLQSADGTATAGQDYTQVSQFVGWSGDSIPVQVVVPIVNDGPGEGEETFTLTLANGDGVDPGNPATTTIRIRESGPQAFFVVDPLIPTDPFGRTSLAYESGTSALLTMRLTEFPASPTTVEYVVEPGGSPIPVTFDGTQEVTIDVPSPPVPTGEDFVRRTVRIIANKAAKIAGFLGEVDPWWWTTSDNWEQCFYCMFALLMQANGFQQCDTICNANFDIDLCNEKAGPAVVPGDVLRQYRDQILTSTQGGQHYANLYTNVSRELFPSLLRDPVLVYDIWRAQDDWIDAFAALNSGSGDSYTVTAQMRDDMIDIVQRVVALGDPGVEVLTGELAALTAVDIAGMTMTQFQAHVESTGAVPTSQQSWGSVKARY